MTLHGVYFVFAVNSSYLRLYMARLNCVPAASQSSFLAERSDNDKLPTVKSGYDSTAFQWPQLVSRD